MFTELNITQKELNSLSPEKLKKLYDKIDEEIKDCSTQITELKESDPFWYYVPSNGELDERGLLFLEKWLKPDDIPIKCESQRDAHYSLADIVAIGGGNQGGKSTTAAIEAFIAITHEFPFSMQDYPKEKLSSHKFTAVRVVGVDYKTLLNTLLPTYKKWCPRKFLKKGRWKDSWSAEQNKLSLYRKDKLIGTIEFMTNTMDVESFQGTPLDLVIYDEEPRKDIYKENLLRFTTADRLRIIIAMTPTKGMTWIWDSVFSNPEDKEGNSVETFKIPSVTNKKAILEVLNEFLNGLDSYDESRMRLLGDFISFLWKII